MKHLTTPSFQTFYSTNEMVARSSPMRTHYWSKNIIERAIWQSKLTVVQQLLETISYQHVLDVGCGDGELLRSIRPESHYTGIDISPTQIAYIKSHMKTFRHIHTGTISLLRSDAVPLPFPSRSFDLVLACDVLEHVLDPLRLIADIKRVLKPKGFALFSIPNEPLWQIMRVMALRWPPRSPDHVSFIESSDITNQFQHIVHKTFLPFAIPGINLLTILLVKKE